jgi:hypothetical protein
MWMNSYLRIQILMLRIKSKSDKGGMAIISGSRGDKSKKENKARAKQLDRDIKGKGLTRCY